MMSSLNKELLALAIEYGLPEAIKKLSHALSPEEQIHRKGRKKWEKRAASLSHESQPLYAIEGLVDHIQQETSRKMSVVVGQGRQSRSKKVWDESHWFEVAGYDSLGPAETNQAAVQYLQRERELLAKALEVLRKIDGNMKPFLLDFDHTEQDLRHLHERDLQRRISAMIPRLEQMLSKLDTALAAVE